MNTYNVFDHQKFLLRRQSSAEGRKALTYREIMTGPDVAPGFDYPLEYMNVAALCLCIALTQTVLEPARPGDLARRLSKPLTDNEFDAAIDSYRDLFSINGNPRFMQGTEPARDKKGRLETSPLSELILSIKKGDKEFLNRPDPDAAVAVDQIPLLLFSRATFFEKSAGRGYLTGTSGDLEIRTFPIDPTSLRRTIWLNVLSRQKQGSDFHLADEPDAKDYWMWKELPDKDVAQGALTLRSGLFWMVARAFIDIEELAESRRCVVTGDVLEAGEHAGTGVVISATGVGYGTKEARADGPEVRRSFFLHPNGPTVRRTIEGKDPFTRHLSVRENSGLIGQMAGLFFSNDEPLSEKVKDRYSVAPVVAQLYDLKEAYLDQPEMGALPDVALLCFGFHMLSSKQNVHGGYEAELFTYPVLGTYGDQGAGIKRAGAMLRKCADRTRKIEEAMLRAIQMCTLREVSTEADAQGRQKFTTGKVDMSSTLRDSSTELWISAGALLKELLERIARASREGIDLADMEDELRAWWTDGIAGRANAIFHATFDDYSSSPAHMVAAHNARRRFNSELYGIDPGIRERRRSTALEETQEL